MKKFALLLTAFLLCFGNLWSQKINYEKSLEQAEKLARPVSWSNRAIELNSNSANHNTLSHLLYALGEYEQAEKVQQKAIEHGRAEKRNIKYYQEELVKIKKRTL